ncbi:hypothetical protein CU097_012898 [Rhizopus azygosporus]|uniref:RRM domain-containing protein n=1 Tax=Rhizopus azygosporus TaxID=86630 RepID=A0A367JTJ4_RHIAZ|nr:hypothetical protein CU097_012898 [Rhizopus azygosporus]
MSLPIEFSSEPKTTLWMGDLESWMDEEYIQQLWFNYLGIHVPVKLIRDKKTTAGYAFIDFSSCDIAQMILDRFNGVLLPNSNKSFKLSWASGGLVDKRQDNQKEYSLFIGDLDYNATEDDILFIFKSRYPTCKSVRVMTNYDTGFSRGYGFVRFTDPSEQQRALVEMQGQVIGSRAIRISFATPKKSISQDSSLITTPTDSPLLQHQDTNTTVFIGGLSVPITEDQLRQYFTPFGVIVYVKIPQGKGCGFVQYTTRSSAELAIQQMNGYQIGNSNIRLSWGTRNHQKQADPSYFSLQQQQKKAYNYWMDDQIYTL